MIKVDKFGDGEQMSQLGRHYWSVKRLFQLSRGFEVMDIPLSHMNIYKEYKTVTLREMIGHIKAVNDASLDYPIILDEDGEIMDGRHRLMKAIIEGRDSIKAVRFEKNPPPCRED